MGRKIAIAFFLLFLITLNAFAQKKECKQKPKRFPSAFSHLTTDYANMNLQADVLPKRYYQFESSLSFGALSRNYDGEKYYGYNSNLVRVGFGRGFEFRGMLSIPGQNIQLNYPENSHLHAPFGLGVKINLLAESSSTPGIGIIGEYQFHNAQSHYMASLVFDKYFFRDLKFSFSAGPSITPQGTSKLIYSCGLRMKDRLKKLGVYTLTSNRYAYLENIFHVGFIYSDNLNYHLTIGYGVHQKDGLFMISYSGILTHSFLQRKMGPYL